MSKKNKPTPYGLTEFHEESEKNNHFSSRELSFWANTVLKKMAPNIILNFWE
jgi:hypothetical protein